MLDKPLHSRLQTFLLFLGGIFLSLGVFAQDANDEEASEEIEEVVVTGSRIVRTDLEGTSPVQIFDRVEITRSGQTSIGQLLREIPSVAGGAQTTQINNGGDGTNRISLRGLGSTRTLVLMNGRRLPPSSTGLASTNLSSAVDLNTIPVSMVDRIDVFKDGASAIYGSDAVAGVVNIITRRDFQGMELNVQSGITQEGDGARNVVDLTIGGSSDTGSFMAYAGYVDEGSICACDRDWAATPLASIGGTVRSYGSSVPPWGRYRFTKDGEDMDVTRGPEYGDFRPYDPSGDDSYNFAPSNHQRQPSIRWSMMFVGDQNLTDFPVIGDVRVFVRASYLNRDSNQKLAETPLAPLAFFSYNAPYTSDNFYNPFGADVPDWRRRMVEDGSRTEDTLTETKQILIGFDGVLNSWHWDAYHAFGETASEGHFGRIYNLERVANAVGPSLKDAEGNWVLDSDGNPMCANDTANCVVLNTFGENSVTQAMIDYITFVDNQSSLQDQKIYSVNFVNPAIMERDAGPIGMAFGWEWREERGADVPDSQVNSLGSGATGTPRKPTSGGYTVNELYGELNIPIVANQDLFELLETNIALRFSDYDSFGATTNGKFGLKYRPVENVLLRTSFSQAFRAPSTSNLFGGSGFSFPALADPCSQDPTEHCIADGVPASGFEPISTQIRTTVGGNPNAQPETAEILTYGVVVEPLEGLSLTIDRFDVALTDALTTLGADFILRQCAEFGSYCELIERFMSGPNAGNPINVVNTITNIGGVDTSGWDIGAYYDWGETVLGDVSITFEATLLSEYLITFADDSEEDLAGRFSDDLDGYFTEYRSTTSVVIERDTFTFSYQIRIIGEAEEEFTDFGTGLTEMRTIESRIYHDVHANLVLPEHNIVLSGGIDNLLDENPPLSLDGFNDNTDVRTFDTAGRYFYFKINYSL
ncbi:MAG: TonB-dependent receptor plug domain-containing protein [Gammaproteobacteria bacterium]|nr:TonB-dependent receptor plug domain-containing protein [Gammaproteobacteria bacterium]